MNPWISSRTREMPIDKDDSLLNISSYYVIYSVVDNGKVTKLFPLVQDTKEEMDSILIQTLNNSTELKEKIFVNDDPQSFDIKPFFAIKKTIISYDYIESDEGISDHTPGKLLSRVIPTDYVEEIYFRDQVRCKGKTKDIRNIIYQGSKGAKVIFKSKKQWLKEK